jgi:C-terminal processing protease CtpA/Prc
MRARPSRQLRLALIVLLGLAALPARAAEPANPAVDRLVQAGRLWGTVRYLHPYLLDREIDWDAALVTAMPRIEAAESPEAYAAALQSMLDALGDPVTRMLPAETASPLKPPTGETPPALTRTLDDGILMLDLSHAAQSMGYRELVQAINATYRDLSQQKAVIVDLRGGVDDDGVSGEILAVALSQIGDALVSRPCRAPGERFVQRSGYPPQEGSTSGGYYEGFVTPAAKSFAPPAGLPAVEKRVVFLVSRASRLPDLALALQAAGDGRIVSEGPLGEEAAVSAQRIAVGAGLTAQLRVSELVPMSDWRGVHADVEVPAGSGAGNSGDMALTAALAELKKPGWGKAAAAAPAAPLPEAVFRPDASYPDMLAPDLAHRRLAVIRAWNVIRFFYPYRTLLDDWDAVLPEFLGKMEKADTAAAYAQTVLEMMARVTDGHTSVYGHPELSKIFGEAGLPIALRWIEEMPVVTVVGSDEARNAGLQPGDAIVAVDGEPVATRIARLSRFITASTEAARLARICSGYLLRGPAGPVTLSVQGLDGSAREVRLTREKGRFNPAPAGETVRILPGNLGYVDLTRLTVPEVDAMFEKVKDTRALILDMRGYPQATAWAIAPRLNTRHAKTGAQFRRTLLSAFSAEESDSGFYFSQPLPELPAGKPLYTHPTVMLIDDRAISQSEHSGLFYEAANGTQFIGTPTAGANGDVTNFTLPGGIHVNFTGHDVRHADGRQLQRVGLQPDVTVAPTRAGIHEGKDEVLERAVRFLDGQ